MLLSKKIIVFLFFAFIVFGKIQAQNTIKGEYNFRNYTVDNGLPSSETYDVEQDNDGNIWIATDRGVVKYDGYRFRTYTKKDGLIDNVVLQIYKDQFGRLWFLSTIHELCYLEKDRIIKYRYNNKIVAHFKQYPVPEKNILVLGNKSLVISLIGAGSMMIDDKGKTKPLHQERATAQIFKFGNKNVWSALSKFDAESTKRGYLYKILYPKKKNGKPTLITELTLNLLRIRCVDVKTHTLLLFTNQIFNLTTRKRIVENLQEPIIHLGSIDNKLWVGSINGGVNLYKLKKGKAVFLKKFLNHYSVSNVFKDSRGGYWFSTLEAGVFYLPFIEVQDFTQKNGLISNKIKNISGFNKAVYLTFTGLGIQKIFDSKIEIIDRKKQNSSIINLGNKLIISAHDGLYFEQKKLIRDRWQRDFYRTKNACLFVTSNIIRVDRNGNLNVLFEDYTPNKKSFQAVMQDNKDIIWLGSKDGLYYLDSKKIKSFHPLEFPFSISDLLYHKNWGKLIATRDDGLYILKKEKFTKIKGLLKDEIKCLFVDETGKLWVGTNGGVNVLTKLKNGQLKIDCFTKNHGLYSNEIVSVFVDQKYVWIATNKGLSKIELTILDRKKTNNTLQLHSIQLKKNKLDLKKELTIPHNEDIVKINFGTINFVTKGKYKYRLHPNSNWSYVKNPQILLLNPEEGLYNLEASFLDENNKWSIMQSIANFEITPPFWKTIYFKLIIVSFLGYLIFLFFRYKKRQFETKQQLLILEQKALFAQMNPHFIFNTLNSIQSFHLYNELDKAEYFLGKFSKLLRETLHVSRKASVSLKTEISMLEKYLELEQMRFSNKFKWTIDSNIDEQYLTLRIPSMLIQPYVENSIKHGFIEKREDYQIDIILTQLDELSLRCEVIDNGIGRSVSVQRKQENDSNKEHVSYGEKITKERLKSYNKRRTDLYRSTIIDIIEDHVSKGTKVEIIIPILK